MKLRNVTRNFSVECETAESIWKQGIGLSFSAKKRNMLFIMPFARRWEFWMFGMRYQIKILFIDKKRRVIDVQKAVPLSLNRNSWKIYRPVKKCKFVLELGKDINKKFAVGDKLKW